jgi:hypothetical protein
MSLSHVIIKPCCRCVGIERRGSSSNIDIIHHFACDHVASGELQFVYCQSEDNVGDCLTTAQARTLFEKGLYGLGMLE